jgi:CHAT domain-containing protein
MSGARSVCVSLWKVNDKATSLLMARFYANLLGARPGLSQPMPKAEALADAKAWLRRLTHERVDQELKALAPGEEFKPLARGDLRAREGEPVAERPFEHPYYWAAFVLVGDPG